MAHLFGTDHICGSSQWCIQCINESAYWHTFYLKFPVTQFVELQKYVQCPKLKMWTQ